MIIGQRNIELAWDSRIEVSKDKIPNLEPKTNPNININRENTILTIYVELRNLIWF